MSRIKRRKRFLVFCFILFVVLTVNNLTQMNKATRQQNGYYLKAIEPKEQPLSPPAVQLVHQEQQLEFVHIPNTDGKQIEYAASLANVTWGICHWQALPLVGPGCQKPDWEGYDTLFNLDDVQLRVNASDEPWHRPPKLLPKPSPYQNKILFTVVRNPYERYISDFYCASAVVQQNLGRNGTNEDLSFVDPMTVATATLNDALQQPTPQQGTNITKLRETPEMLNEFLMDRVSFPHFLQSDYVFDERGASIVDYVLRHEHLSQQFRELMHRFDLPVSLNSTISQHGRSNRQRHLTVQDLFPETIERINQVAQSDFTTFGYKMLNTQSIAEQRARVHTVHRIYYINLLKNTKRREMMESWLREQPIPFERINATIGSSDPNDCVARKQTLDLCRGVSGLSKTELDIIRNHNTSGLTIVLEDDFVVTKNLDFVVERTLKLVPSDWDVIRWDCWGKVPQSFEKLVPGKVVRTAHQRPCIETEASPCWFAGGTHAMLWREESVFKLEQVWSEVPFNDIDFRLSTEKLNSYCVNIGIGMIQQPDGEFSDIPKVTRNETAEFLEVEKKDAANFSFRLPQQ